MNTTKKTIFLFLLLLILGLGLSRFMPKEEGKEISIGLRIGVGDDITGVLLKQIIKTNKDINVNSMDNEEENKDTLYDFTFKDC
ncbi:hypothetical protein [Tissierella praeacuta]|uniref:hypothetical protein n=1 Tax=Tissierella praeacuta TaxID=43131 RepID=UPI00333F223D